MPVNLNRPAQILSDPSLRRARTAFHKRPNHRAARPCVLFSVCRPCVLFSVCCRADRAGAALQSDPRRGPTAANVP
jgi:hypothetical protein